LSPLLRLLGGRFALAAVLCCVSPYLIPFFSISWLIDSLRGCSRDLGVFYESLVFWATRRESRATFSFPPFLGGIVCERTLRLCGA